MTIDEKPLEQLSIDSITRQVIEAAARRIEDLQGNASYTQAWRIACRALRAMKPD